MRPKRGLDSDAQAVDLAHLGLKIARTSTFAENACGAAQVFIGARQWQGGNQLELAGKVHLEAIQLAGTGTEHKHRTYDTRILVARACGADKVFNCDGWAWTNNRQT